MILFCPEYQKTIFSDLISKINTLNKIFVFSQKPWINPFEKFQFFGLFKTLPFGLKIILSCREYRKTIFSGPICEINTLDKIFEFLNKIIEFLKNFDFWTILKLCFFGLKSILFYPQ